MPSFASSRSIGEAVKQLSDATKERRPGPALPSRPKPSYGRGKCSRASQRDARCRHDAPCRGHRRRRCRSSHLLQRDAVQGVESTNSQQPTRGRQLATAGGTAHRELVDVGERGELVHQRVTGEERTLPNVRELRPGPPAGNKVARGVGVAPSIAAHGEVQECPRLRRLAHVTARARGGLFGGSVAR